jgi:TRAP-type C4-dicarboxylate transport system permease small subunit
LVLVVLVVRLEPQVLLAVLHILELLLLTIFLLLAVVGVALVHLVQTQQAVAEAVVLGVLELIVPPHLLLVEFRAAVLTVLLMAAHLVQMP